MKFTIQVRDVVPCKKKRSVQCFNALCVQCSTFPEKKLAVLLLLSSGSLLPQNTVRDGYGTRGKVYRSYRRPE